MGKNDFFAFTSRTKYINRWALMRNTRYETLSEHSAEVSQLCYALAVIGNEYLGKNHNCERAALLGLYHDVPEIITGDLPTPVKYYSAETKEAYKAVEKNASKQLLGMLPPELLPSYEPLFKKKNEDKVFKNVYLLVTLSFLFYIPVVVGAGAIPMLGMLMLPKTICYVLIMFVFNKKLKEL